VYIINMRTFASLTYLVVAPVAICVGLLISDSHSAHKTPVLSCPLLSSPLLSSPLLFKGSDVSAGSGLALKHKTFRKLKFQGGGQPPLPVAPGSPREWNPDGSVTGGVINLATGNLTLMQHIVGWSALGAGVSLDLVYNSEVPAVGPFGNGWTQSYDWSVTGTSPAIVHRPDGSTDTYTLSGGVYVAPPGVNMALTWSNGTFTLTTKDGDSYNFGGSGQLASMSDRNSNATTLSYNPSGHLVQVKDQSGRCLILSYNSNNQVNQVTDCLGRVWSFTYDSSGDLTEILLPALNGNNYSVNYVYSSPGRLSQSIDPAGNSTSFTYGSNGILSSWKNALGDVTSLTYTSVISPPSNGATANTGTRNHYPAGTVAIASVSDSLGISSSNCTDSSGRNLANLDAYGDQTTFTWDSNNDKLSKTLPDGSLESWTFDPIGNTLSETNGVGQRTNMTYDNLNDLTSLAQPCGCTSYWTFDAKGNPKTYTSGTGVTSNYGVLGNGRISTITDSLGFVTNLSYDQYGNMVTATDPLLNTTSYSFSNSGITLSSLSRPGDPAIAYGYDAWLQETSETANGQVESKTYDPDGRVLTQNSPEVGQTSYAYDGIGDKTQMTTSVGTTTYAFNGAGLMASSKDSSGAGYSQIYDSNGRVTQNVGPSDTTNYYYDVDSRVTSEVDSVGLTESFGYDPASRLAQEKVTNTGNGFVIRNYTSSYGQNEMLSQVSDSVTNSVTSFGYNADEQETSESRTGIAPYSETKGYDARAYLNAFSIASNGNTVLNATMYHNQDGELSSLADSSGNSDLQGNYTWNSDGTLASYPGKNLTRVCSYDSWGRLTGLAESAYGQTAPTFGYLYDNDNNLQTRLNIASNSSNWYDRSLHHGAVGLGQFSSDSTMKNWTAQPSSASFHAGYASGSSSSVYSPAGNEVLTISNGVVTNSIESDSNFDMIFSGSARPSDFYHVNGEFGDEEGPLLREVTDQVSCYKYILPPGLTKPSFGFQRCLSACGREPSEKCVEGCFDKFQKELGSEAFNAMCKFVACEAVSRYPGQHPGKDPCDLKPMDSDLCQDCCDEKFFMTICDCIKKGGNAELCTPKAYVDLNTCYANCDLDY